MTLHDQDRPDRPDRPDLLDVVRTVWQERDPVPPGMVARMQEAAALAASGWEDADLDIELMLLVERTDELTGARGASTTAYTLRFAHDGVDLLLRVTPEDRTARIDGWIVPPSPVAVRLLRDDGAPEGPLLDVGDTGRFELTDLEPGLLRLRLEPAEGGTTFITPAFEI